MECLISALEQRVVIGDMLNGKLGLTVRRFIELLDWPADRHLVGTMVCGGVSWLVALVVTFANGGDASSMWIASVSGACCALVFIAFKIP